MLILFFIIGVATVTFARPLGRLKKEIDAEVGASWATEKTYVAITRSIGCVFCAVSLGIMLVEYFVRR